MKINLNGDKERFFDCLEDFERIMDQPMNDNNLIELQAVCQEMINVLICSSVGVNIDSEQIRKIVDSYFNVNSARKTRKIHIRQPRQIGMTLACEFTKEPLYMIGETFGGYDHATVISSKKKITNLLSNRGEKKLKNDYNNLVNIIKGLKK